MNKTRLGEATRGIQVRSTLTLLALSLFCFPAHGRQDDGSEFFEKKVRPLLAEHCYNCHSSTSKPVMGSLILDRETSFRKGGTRGAPIEPGDPESSLLIKVVRHQDEKLRMPPTGKLAEGKIATLAQWVQMGAPWGLAGPSKQPSGTGFWAFQAPSEPPLPQVENTAWAASPIDRFILAALEAKGLRPARAADKCDHIFVWDYAVNFSWYLTPTPNLPVLKANRQIFHENNVSGYFIQTNETERRELKAWVLAKLIWDPSRNSWDLMHDFVYGYYGQAAPALAEYNEMLWEMSAHTNPELLLEGREVDWEQKPSWAIPNLVGYGARFEPTKEYLSKEFLEASKAIFDRAESLAENEEILGRVQADRIPIMYTELYQLKSSFFRGERLDELEYFLKLLDRFEQFAKSFNRYDNGHLGEVQHHVDTKTWIAELREVAAGVQK